VPHGEYGDLSREAQGEHERAIFHDRHDRVAEVWVHHSSVSFLLKARPCALEAAIIAIAVTGEHMQFDCQAARKDCGPRSRNFDQASRK
jgi:hypothetical protein